MEPFVRRYQPKLKLTARSWRRYVVVSLMISQKYWDDRCLRNIDFTVAWRCVLPDAGALNLRDLNLMERQFLAGLGYDLYIQPVKYVRRAESSVDESRRRRGRSLVNRGDAAAATWIFLS